MTKEKGGVKVVMTVPEAGAKLGLSRNGSYEAAARGDIPTIKIGRLLRVPTIAFERMLTQAGSKSVA
jgi:excisionase family DNA binding protein